VTGAVSVVVPAALDGQRVDRVVSFLSGLPRSEAAAVIDSGGVTLDGAAVATRSRKVAAGDVLEITVPPPDPGPPADGAVAVDVVHADAAVIVVDKPAGLVVHPGSGNPRGTLVNGLLARFPDLGAHDWPAPDRPGIVHRIDKGTSGLLMVARTPAALAALSAQLEARSVERRYLALVRGSVEAESGMIDAPLGRSVSDPTRMAVRADGRRAVTRYEVVARLPTTTLVRCALETGRTHQIRVHLAAIGHPVVGDERYHGRGAVPGAGRGAPGAGGGASGAGGGVPGVGRPFLHAAVLGFDHPVSGARLRFESPLPADLEAVLAQAS
jgi:23S rRNA pseudouridine1911/1915/1917 synthase